MQDMLDVLKAVGDETRLRALCALKGGELCVCQLTALLELAPSTVSKHLSILRAARLVESRKEGRWMYYKIAPAFRTQSTGKIVGLLLAELVKTDRMMADQKRLKAICDEGMDAICRRLFCKTK